jgi:hypothetical protein
VLQLAQLREARLCLQRGRPVHVPFQRLQVCRTAKELPLLIGRQHYPVQIKLTGRHQVGWRSTWLSLRTSTAGQATARRLLQLSERQVPAVVPSSLVKHQGAADTPAMLSCGAVGVAAAGMNRLLQA